MIEELTVKGKIRAEFDKIAMIRLTEFCASSGINLMTMEQGDDVTLIFSANADNGQFRRLRAYLTMRESA